MSGGNGNSGIDFVVTWVDGGDAAWRLERGRFAPPAEADDRERRYRDWGLMRYWFRGVAKFAPWVDHIHFVTWGHVPGWLNTDEPRLHVARHGDYMPPEYLPTFNSNAIELNLHRMGELSERFVLFNDDMFLLRRVAPERFFRGGAPRDWAVQTPVYSGVYGTDEQPFHIDYNNTFYMNARLRKRECVGRHFGKWYSPRYGAQGLRNALLAPWPTFPGFLGRHLPLAYTKTSFAEGWETFGEAFDATSRRRFRSSQDVSHWLVRDLRLARGAFSPIRPERPGTLRVGPDTLETCCAVIAGGKRAMICLNDTDGSDGRFEECAAALRESFSALLPEKCAFER